MDLFGDGLLLDAENLAQVVALHFGVVTDAAVMCEPLSGGAHAIMVRLVQTTLLHQQLDLVLLLIHIQNMSCKCLVDHIYH